MLIVFFFSLNSSEYGSIVIWGGGIKREGGFGGFGRIPTLKKIKKNEAFEIFISFKKNANNFSILLSLFSYIVIYFTSINFTASM